METNISALLSEYGLDSTETAIFIYLIKNRETTAYKIAKELHIHRSTCYDVLERLISKGFVALNETKETKYYTSNEMSRVISGLKDKENILLSLIPELETIEKKQDLYVRLLEGAEGQKQFNFNLFSLAKTKQIDYCYIIGNGEAAKLSSNIFIERLLKESKKHNLKEKMQYRGIWDSKFKGSKLVKKYDVLGKNKFLPDIPSKVTTIIYGDYVGYLYVTDEPFVIDIKNKLLAEEMKNYFEKLWLLAK